MDITGEQAADRPDRAHEDVAAVETMWGAVIDVHLSAMDLQRFDRLIASVRPGAARDAILSDLISATLRLGLDRVLTAIPD